MTQNDLRERPDGDNQLDLFAPAFVDVAFRDQQDLMENPLCTLGKKPRKEPIRYQVGEKFITVTANSETGMATIYDHDILIWVATQIREAADRGLPTTNRLFFHPYNLLKSIRRHTGGDHYERLKEALRRLQGTMVETNVRLYDDLPGVKTKRVKSDKGVSFQLVNAWGYNLDPSRPDDDRWFIEIPHWMYAGIVNHKLVLSIDPDYFLLDSGIERWLYRIFRKHAGVQDTGWQFTMKQLHAKSGSTQRLSNFALEVRKAVARANAHGRLPGYVLSIARNKDGDEIVSGLSRAKLAIDDPQYQPRLHVRRRMADSGFTNAEKHDNKPFAEMMKNKKTKAAKGKGQPLPKPKPMPPPPEGEDFNW